jgi:hypothetical protein
MMRCRLQLVEEKRSLVQLSLATDGRGAEANPHHRYFKPVAHIYSSLMGS